jgi:acyl dehydratase
MLTINGLDDIRQRTGEELGVSAWHEVTQPLIDRFAAATDDYEEIHVNPERAAQTPFGVTIAHGLYTLSLGPKFLYEIFEVNRISLPLNYGFNKVRFIAPVPVGSRVRMRARLLSVQDVERLPSHTLSEGVLVTVEEVFEIDGHNRPACVAECLFMYFS